jgi:hypothetical protein
MITRQPLGNNRFRYSFDRSEYSVAPGDTVAVTVYLRETFDPSTSSSLLTVGSDGLISGALRLQIGSPIPTRPARVQSASAIVGNPRFDFAIIPQLPETMFENSAGIIALSSNPVFGEIGLATRQCVTVSIELGTFGYTAGPVPGEVTCLLASNLGIHPRMSTDYLVTASGLVLDDRMEPDVAIIKVNPQASSAHFQAGKAQRTDVVSRSGRRW